MNFQRRRKAWPLTWGTYARPAIMRSRIIRSLGGSIELKSIRLVARRGPWAVFRSLTAPWRLRMWTATADVHTLTGRERLENGMGMFPVILTCSLQTHVEPTRAPLIRSRCAAKCPRPDASVASSRLSRRRELRNQNKWAGGSRTSNVGAERTLKIVKHCFSKDTN